MHSIEKISGHRPFVADTPLFGRCVIMRQQALMTMTAGPSCAAKFEQQFAWARAISNYMALDFKEQNDSSAAMPQSAADYPRASVARTAIRPNVTAKAAGHP